MNNNIHSCWWFDGNAKEAADFYCTIFPDSKITIDTPMVVNFELWGQKFMGLNGGPMFTKNPSISYFVVFDTTEEVDIAWTSLSEGGEVLMALDTYPWSEKYGWLQDKFGVSWQLSVGDLKDTGQRIAPSLMFVRDKAGRAEAAIQLYTALFENSSVSGVQHYGEGEGDRPDLVKHAQFIIDGKTFMAMDSSGPHDFDFNEGISLVVECKTQEEIDKYWNALTERGEESMCGWLKDEFGVSWQIIPADLGKWMSDPEKRDRVMQKVMSSKKFNIEELKNA